MQMLFLFSSLYGESAAPFPKRHRFFSTRSDDFESFEHVKQHGVVSHLRALGACIMKIACLQVNARPKLGESAPAAMRVRSLAALILHLARRALPARLGAPCVLMPV
jgi:hypothetical protein